VSTQSYPLWSYYPRMARPPAWVDQIVAAFAASESVIESRTHSGVNSNAVLLELRPALQALGYEVEAGKSPGEKLRRPVLFGDQGVERVAYEIDAFHPADGIAVEIEAGRGAMGNAIYRDLVRTSLLVDARFLVLGAMIEYRFMNGGRQFADPSYDKTRSLLDAIYASGRLRLPFEGVLLVGY
jgi:hypothetical protein